MKFRLCLVLCLVSVVVLGQTQRVKYQDFFINHTLRVDLFHTASKSQEIFTLDKMYRQGPWAGSVKNLIDPFDNGQYCVRILDKQSKKLLFSRGFNSYCAEYRTTDPAASGILKTYHETVMVPFPRHPVVLEIQSRNRQNRLNTVYRLDIEPNTDSIHTETVETASRIIPLHASGDPHQKLDLVILAEGYTSGEESKLRRDLAKTKSILLETEPFQSYQNDINITCVFPPSEESGCDEPTHGRFKNTPLGASFNALGLYRYLLTEENRRLRDVASRVPYDSILIMVNHDRYGGGGIYNFYCVFTAGNERMPYLLIHEFGHSLAGLADEYYTSSVAYNEFYPPGVEPTEPNITAFLDRDVMKWKNHITPGIDLPTEWGKKRYEELGMVFTKKRTALQSRIATLKKNEAPLDQIKRLQHELTDLSSRYRRDIERFFDKHAKKDAVGLFEGAGYAASGLYRPMLDCIMFSGRAEHFCKVCQEAIKAVIRFHCH